MSLNQTMLRPTIHVIAILAAFGVNILANIRPIGGLTLGEISNQLFEEVLITPANYAFAIWGLIYLGLFSFAVYQALPNQQEKPILGKMGYWLVLASFAQIVWVFLFQLRLFTWSFLAMLLILLPLLRIYVQLSNNNPKISRQERWFVKIPLTIYLAWISVATIVNGAVSLTAIGWEGGEISPEVWTAIMMGIGAAIALVIYWLNQDFAFTAVFIWALSAIAVRHWTVPLISGTGILLTIILLAFPLLNQGRRKHFRRG